MAISARKTVKEPEITDSLQLSMGSNLSSRTPSPLSARSKKSETIFRNARIVTDDSIVTGSLQVVDGVIADISTNDTVCGKTDLDCNGDFILPGLIELHTDHLETHYMPRPGVKWEMMSAIQAHDAQLAAAGITTVFDCLRCGQENSGQFDTGEMLELARSVNKAEAQGRLRVEHRMHLRCEVSAFDVIDDFNRFADMSSVELVSLMDHAPGQRQFSSLESYAAYHQSRLKMSDVEFAKYVDTRMAASKKYSEKHRTLIAGICAERNIVLASHDDATIEHVQESISHGVKVAEFPTTVAAAKGSHDAGMSILMGAPNVVRGHSHTGNVSASELVEQGCMDILSSDYIPSSLLSAVFKLSYELDVLSLPQAIAFVSRNPARVMNLDDRGEIACGLRADLVQVTHSPLQDPAPVVRSVWRGGDRVL